MMKLVNSPDALEFAAEVGLLRVLAVIVLLAWAYRHRLRARSSANLVELAAWMILTAGLLRPTVSLMIYWYSLTKSGRPVILFQLLAATQWGEPLLMMAGFMVLTFAVFLGLWREELP